jgi:hypothetical protein
MKIYVALQVCVEFSRTPGSPRKNIESVSVAFRRSKAAVICVDTQYPYEGGEEVVISVCIALSYS